MMQPQLFYQGEYVHAQFLNFGKYTCGKLVAFHKTHGYFYIYLFLEMNNSGRGAMLFCLSSPLDVLIVSLRTVVCKVVGPPG